MTKVYDQFDSAFASVSAWAILRDGVAVGKIAIKHGAAVSAFVHLTGSQMARGRAGGGGYDRSTAAVRDAIIRLYPEIADDKRAAMIRSIQAAESLEGAGGSDWTTIVSRAGFELAAVI